MVDGARMALDAIVAARHLKGPTSRDGGLLVAYKVVTRQGLHAGDRRGQQRDCDQKGQQCSHLSYRLHLDVHA
jgi:hypothetical protein